MRLLVLVLLSAVCTCHGQTKPSDSTRRPKKSWATYKKPYTKSGPPYKKPYTKVAEDAAWMFRDDAQLAAEPCNSTHQKKDAFSSRLGLAAGDEHFTLNNQNDTSIENTVSSLPTETEVAKARPNPFARERTLEKTTPKLPVMYVSDTPLDTKKSSTKKKFSTNSKKKSTKEKFVKTKKTKGWIKDKLMPPPTERPTVTEPEESGGHPTTKTVTESAESEAHPTIRLPIFEENGDTVEIKVPQNVKTPTIHCGDEEALADSFSSVDGFAKSASRVECRLLNVLESHDDITVSATMHACHDPVDVQILMKSTADVSHPAGPLDWNFTFVPQQQNARMLLPNVHLAILPHAQGQPLFFFVKEPKDELEDRKKHPRDVQNITIEMSMWSPFGDRAEEELLMRHTFHVDPWLCMSQIDPEAVQASGVTNFKNTAMVIGLVIGLLGAVACTVGVYLKVVRRSTTQQDNLDLVQNIHTQPIDQEQNVAEAASPPESSLHATESSLNNYTPRHYAPSPPMYTATAPSDYNQNEVASPNRTQLILRNEISDPGIPNFTHTRLDFGSSEWLENLERNSSIGTQIENNEDKHEINAQNIDHKTCRDIRRNDQTRLEIRDHDLGANTEVL